MNGLNSKEVDRLRSVECAAAQMLNKKIAQTIEASDFVQFVINTPSGDGFRSHRPYFGPILTRLRYLGFKVVTWVNLPGRQAMIACSLEIVRMNIEIVQLRNEMLAHKQELQSLKEGIHDRRH